MSVFLPGTKKASGREIANLRHQRHQSDECSAADLWWSVQISADLCSARHPWGSLGVLPWWPQHVAGGQGWLGSCGLAVGSFWGPKWQNSASDGHCKACVRLFLPPQASLKLHSGQASETSWKFLEYLGISWIILNCSKLSLFILFSPEAHIRYQCWVGKSSEGPRELEAQWAFLPQNSKWRVETASKPAKAHSRGQPFSWYVPHRLGGDIEWLERDSGSIHVQDCSSVFKFLCHRCICESWMLVRVWSRSKSQTMVQCRSCWRRLIGLSQYN